MSLRLRLVISFLGLSALMIIIGVVGIFNARNTSAVVKSVLETTSPELFLLGQIEAAANDLRESAIHYNYLRQLGQDSSEIEEFDTVRTELNDLIAQLGAITEDQTQYEQIAAQAEELINKTRVVRGFEDSFVSGNVLAQRIEAMDTAEDNFKNTVHGAVANETQQFQNELAAIVQNDAQSETFYLVSIFITGVVALALSLFLARLITRPVANLKAVANRMMHGDYTQRAATGAKDEIGELALAFNSMADTVENREFDLRDLNTTLENRVVERTRELAKATELAQESARLKSEFMSTMSHELRTPLNAILGFSGIMLQGMGGEMDDDALHMLERIDSNSQRLLKLINDILDIARIEAGRMELVDAPFSPQKLVKRWQAEMSVLAEKKALGFEVSLDENLPDTLYGDAERITQITVNLLSNAFKFTDQGEVKLNVFGMDDTLNIQVSDTGVGIPPHALNYIFDEFRQVDGSSKRVYGGSGLGLAIVRNMCRTMNGTVNVTSELGEGSVFTVTLPLRTQPETQLLATA